jgi:Domain of unknown function (DUF2760)
MSRIAVAFQVFFAALASKEKAEQLRAALSAGETPAKIAARKPPSAVVPPVHALTPGRSEAITLLAALQREARLVDLAKQPLAAFSDEEIGAAARNVLTGCSTVLDRFFQLEPVTDAEENSPCEVPRDYDPAQYKLTGRVEGTGPFRGTIVHHGWRATTVKLPEWIGSKDSALVIAPAEVEI